MKLRLLKAYYWFLRRIRKRWSLWQGLTVLNPGVQKGLLLRYVQGKRDFVVIEATIVDMDKPVPPFGEPIEVLGEFMLARHDLGGSPGITINLDANAEYVGKPKEQPDEPQ